MPAKSGKQLRWAYWTASGKNPDVPASVGAKFVKETPKAKRKSLMSAHQKAAKGFRRRAKEGYA